MAIAALPAFAIPKWWLTFYITAEPASLHKISDRLSTQGAVNLGGTDSGFIYPKLAVTSDPALVAKLVVEVQQLAAMTGVEVLSIDVDTSPEVENSLFKELIRFDRNGS